MHGRLSQSFGNDGRLSEFQSESEMYDRVKETYVTPISEGEEESRRSNPCAVHCSFSILTHEHPYEHFIRKLIPLEQEVLYYSLPTFLFHLVLEKHQEIVISIALS